MPQTPKKTPEKEDRFKVGYFNHFPKDFLKPYGNAVIPSELEDEHCMSKLRNFTCEWLCRPGFAMSEVAETLYKNKEIDDLAGELFEGPAYKKYFEMLSNVTDLCLPFWPGSVETEEDVAEIDKKLVKKNLKKLQTIFGQDDDKTDDGNFFNEYSKVMTELGGKMFLMGIHLRVMATLLTNMNDYGEKCTKAPNLSSFKDCPCINDLGDAIYKDMVDKWNAGSQKHRDTPRKSLKRFFSGDGEEPSTSQSTPSKRGKKKLTYENDFDADQ